eukprot:13059518-Alexandrium_andersonii.AAC.1
MDRCDLRRASNRNRDRNDPSAQINRARVLPEAKTWDIPDRGGMRASHGCLRCEWCSQPSGAERERSAYGLLRMASP